MKCIQFDVILGDLKFTLNLSTKIVILSTMLIIFMFIILLLPFQCSL